MPMPILKVSFQKADSTSLTNTDSLSLLPMVAHHPVMEELSALVLDDDSTSLRIISKMLEKFHFKVLPFQIAEAALDSLRNGAAKEEELDLILAEVHLSTIRSDTLAYSELLHHILNELEVPLITMCAYDDENAVSECMAVGACFHVLKPLNTGSFNILRQKALQHKSRRATPEGSKTRHLTKSIMVSSSTPNPNETFILKRNSLSNPGSEESEEPEGYSKRTSRFTWTIELHEMFLEAVEVLGDKFATPERILKQMNAKGLTCLTSKQVASHLQKHRLRKAKAKQGEQCQKNARVNPLSELIRSVYNAATSGCITPRVATDIRGVYPSRLWTKMKKKSVEAEASKSYTYAYTFGMYEDNTKSVWDKYQMSLQKGSSRSSRRRSSRHQRFATKNKDVIRDEGILNGAAKTAGKIGYGAPVESSGSSSLLTSLLDQVVENNLTEAAGNNCTVGNTDLLEGIMNKEYTAAMGPSDGWAHLQSNGLLDDTNINSSAHMNLTDPSNGWGESSSFWMSQLEGPQEQQNLGPEDLLQVDDAWNDVLGLANQPSLINTDELMAQEAAVRDAPVYDPAAQFAPDNGLWSWSPGMLF